MTDLEKFVELYKSFGIECKVVEEKPYNKDGAHKAIYLGDIDSEDATTSEKLTGYSGFGSDVIFDMEGKFIRQGFWE